MDSTLDCSKPFHIPKPELSPEGLFWPQVSISQRLKCRRPTIACASSQVERCRSVRLVRFIWAVGQALFRKTAFRPISTTEVPVVCKVNSARGGLPELGFVILFRPDGPSFLEVTSWPGWIEGALPGLTWMDILTHDEALALWDY